MTYQFLEHTADARVRCEADSLEGLLSSGAQALYAIALENTRQDTGVSQTIHVTARNREELLVRWLQELIFLLDTQQFVALEFEFAGVSDDQVEAKLGGYLCSGEERAKEVKSATYHGLAILQQGSRYSAEFLLDL
jgi:SHS2 domain-containing protein